MEAEYRDAVIVGTGLAGLTTALALSDRNVLLVTKTSEIASGSSPWAQGGVAFPVDEADMASHIRDTLVSGSFSNREESVEFLIHQAPAALRWLEGQGVQFDRDGAGNYRQGREGAHSRRRILHVGADATGAGLVSTLAERVRHSSTITVATRTVALALVPGGLLLFGEERGLYLVRSPRVVLAGGGLGQLFSATTAPREGTGDAMALAYHAGARVTDLEMVQFHPTALKRAQPEPGPLPLLTEALRGEGATLVVKDPSGGFLALDTGHPLGSLGPRDVVARAIFRQLQAGNQVWLDARMVQNPESRFPTVTRLCQEAGLDVGRDLLPVTPAVHYTMGGIETDTSGRTNLPGVWAVGECANSGVHGANRLASNSLLECVVFGLAAARDEGHRPVNLADARVLEGWRHLKWPAASWARTLRDQVGTQMSRAAGPIRDAQGLEAGRAWMESAQGMWDKASSGGRTLSQWTFDEFVAILETRSLLTLGLLLLDQALTRAVSLGAHFRSDSPEDHHA